MSEVVLLDSNTNTHRYAAGAKTKGYIKNTSTGEIKSFMFNPSELEFSRGATYSEIASPGLSYPLTQYVRGNAIEFSVTLKIYDRPYTGEVGKWEQFFASFIPPTDNSIPFQKPEGMTFVMGSFIRDCVITSLNTKYTSFTGDLLPDEAEFTLNLRQV